MKADSISCYCTSKVHHPWVYFQEIMVHISLYSTSGNQLSWWGHCNKVSSSTCPGNVMLKQKIISSSPHSSPLTLTSSQLHTLEWCSEGDHQVEPSTAGAVQQSSSLWGGGWGGEGGGRVRGKDERNGGRGVKRIKKWTGREREEE